MDALRAWNVSVTVRFRCFDFLQPRGGGGGGGGGEGGGTGLHDMTEFGGNRYVRSRPDDLTSDEGRDR